MTAARGRGTGRREPSPALLSTPEQFIIAFVVVVALITMILPWQLDVEGTALWLPVALGAVAFVAAWAAMGWLVYRRSRSPEGPPPHVSRRRNRIAVAALLVGAAAVATRLFIVD